MCSDTPRIGYSRGDETGPARPMSSLKVAAGALIGRTPGALHRRWPPTLREMSPGRLLRATTELALRLDRLRPGVLDGPPPEADLAHRVAAEPRPDPRDLVAEADRLRRALAAVDAADPAVRYLDAQLVALRCGARLAAGARLGYLDEVRDRFGVVPRRTDPDVHRQAHHRLADLLPGRGPLAARMQAYREADVVPAGRLRAAVHALTAELRTRTRDELGLPTGERADVEIVEGRPWTALTRYRGGHRSSVLLDAGSPLRAGRLLGLLAHEIYPGHHTQSCRADAAAVRYPVLGLRLVHSPQGLIAEGAAEAAPWVLPGPGWGAVARRVLAGVGVRLDGELAERIELATTALGRVRQDAALLRHVDGAAPDTVVAHLSRWLLVPDGQARRILEFLDHPQWRSYPVTYAEGGPLVRSWLERFPAGPAAGLRLLLDTPVLPEDLSDGAEVVTEGVGEPFTGSVQGRPGGA